MGGATLELNKTQRDGRGEGAVRRICFVCTGNTCRSPMAAAVANAQARAEGLTIEALSAGLYAAEGAPISENAVSALERAGIKAVERADYHTHSAHTLTESELEQIDLLIPMTRTHAIELLLRYPSAVRKIVCMPEEISDPFGGDLSVYEACLSQIQKGVSSLLHTEV